MGLFSDKCEALIDGMTGRALQGDALAKGRLDADAPRCGNAVPKAARFCNKCGSPAPGGWWKCHSCGKWVGAEANFCWNCKAALHPQSRAALSDGEWQRPAGAFAQVARIRELRRLVEGGLKVQAGTVALLLEGGKLREVLEPGPQSLDSIRHRFLSLFTTSEPQTVVLIDAGDVVLPLRFGEATRRNAPPVINGPPGDSLSEEGPALRTKESLPVGCYTEVCFRFIPGIDRGADFLANVLKSQESLSYEQLGGWLRREVRAEVANLIAANSLQELVGNPQRRLQIEDALRKALAPALERGGLELVRVASVEYTGADYEKLREVAGDLVVRTQEIEFQQRLRELTAGTEMNRFKSDYDLDEYVRQLAQEKSISLEMQQHEMVILKQVHRHELDKAEAGYQMAAEMEKTAHQIGVKIQWDDYTREKLGKNEELQIWITTQWLDVRLKKKQQEMDEAVGQLKLQEEKNRIAVAELRERAQILAGQDIKTLIALLPDNAQRTQLLELFRQTQAAGMGPGQILALQAGASPAVADALARMSEVRREDLEREFAERKKLSDDSAARLERVLTEALRAMAEQSKSRVQVNMPGPMV